MAESERTVYASLECLAAHLAVQLADAEFLLEFYDDGFFVVAEQALEGGWEGLRFALGWGLAAGLLAFAHCEGV